jgi:Arc/MetJ family transcription regulator
MPKVNATSQTISDVDSEALSAAQRALGTATPRDTVNEALREAARRAMVAEYLEFMKVGGAAALREDGDAAWQ